MPVRSIVVSRQKDCAAIDDGATTRRTKTRQVTKFASRARCDMAGRTTSNSHNTALSPMAPSAVRAALIDRIAQRDGAFIPTEQQTARDTCTFEPTKVHMGPERPDQCGSVVQQDSFAHQCTRTGLRFLGRPVGAPNVPLAVPHSGQTSPESASTKTIHRGRCHRAAFHVIA
jgi:hypothetical protein